MKRLTPLVAALLLAGCNSLGWGPDEVERSFPYKAEIAVDENQSDLAISVAAPPGVTVDIVREAARYQVTRHCLQTFGDSDADWQIDPATGDWAYTRTPDAMIFRARCQGR
ncbi:MAG: hypothetical protein WBB85_20705 [Albidovulum sp.]|jgi:hypothetical protein|uniref:hypothetical protein n=1 Tax=Albidovulum sp. TaxID=1872424 RepID=UPI003CA30C9E